MIESKFTYLIINILTILYPAAQSFEHRLNYYRKWKFLFLAIIITGAFFIVWDILKTYYGVWSFNDDYLIGIYLFNLPLEEWLFFLTVPYSCVFIYEVLNYYFRKDYLGNISLKIGIILGIINIILAFIFYERAYTFVVFLFNGIFLLLHSFVFKFQWLGRFFLAYFVSLIPFFLVNGLLTSIPVVIYNDAENMGIRLFSIPVEDTMYSMLLFLMNVSLYEFFRTKWKK